MRSTLRRLGVARPPTRPRPPQSDSEAREPWQETSPNPRLRRCLTRRKATPSRCGFRARRASAGRGRLPACGRAGAQGPRAPKHGRCTRAFHLRRRPSRPCDRRRVRHALREHGREARPARRDRPTCRARRARPPRRRRRRLARSQEPRRAGEPHTADAPALQPKAAPGRDHPAVPPPEPPRKPPLRPGPWASGWRIGARPGLGTSGAPWPVLPRPRHRRGSAGRDRSAPDCAEPARNSACRRKE
jgi:hypothetical protein